MELTPNLNLKKPSKDDFYNVQDFNDNMDILDELLSESLSSTSYIEKTMNSGSWDLTEKTYSFETEYPSNQYDVELNPSKTMTAAQLDAWNAAMITGDPVNNVFTALGDVPTVNIPVFLKVVKKNG